MDGEAFFLCVKLLNFYSTAICHFSSEWEIFTSGGNKWWSEAAVGEKLLKLLEKTSLGVGSSQSRINFVSNFIEKLRAVSKTENSTFIITFTTWDEFEAFILINSKGNHQLREHLVVVKSSWRKVSTYLGTKRKREKWVSAELNCRLSKRSFSLQKRHKMAENVVFSLLIM